jgi:hypothetical protein
MTAAPPAVIAVTAAPERPLIERVGTLRAFARSHPTLGEAAAALGVSAGTLRRNLDVRLATAGALDVIEEGLPG